MIFHAFHHSTLPPFLEFEDSQAPNQNAWRAQAYEPLGQTDPDSVLQEEVVTSLLLFSVL